MNQENVYRATSEKSPVDFARDFTAVVQKYGFIVNNSETMNMATTFLAHGVDVAEGFDLHMIQVCKPTKAVGSLTANPERAVLMPKFVMVFSKDGVTQVRYLSYGADDIKAVVDDPVLPGSLAETFAKIRSMIDEAV